MAVIILARGSQSCSGMAPTSQGGFGVMEVRLSPIIPLLSSWVFWIQFAIILLRIFALMFIKEIGLKFSFLDVSLCGLGMSVYWLHRMS
jgi:hypothetical protein